MEKNRNGKKEGRQLRRRRDRRQWRRTEMERRKALEKEG